MEKVYLLEGARTPFGEMGGALKKVDAINLGVAAGREAIHRAGVQSQNIDQVVFGNVIQSSTQAAYLSRHIGLKCEVPETSPALTVNRLCGSGLQAVVSAAQSMRLGESHTALVGGAENMSMSPHADFSTRANGAKYGAIKLEDMLMETLTDHYAGCGMGLTAENLAEKYEISRAEQDEAAVQSHQRAARAQKTGRFAREIVSVDTKKGAVTDDEHIRPDTNGEKLGQLRPAFKKDGTVTAGTSSGINDGAAALVLADGLTVEKQGLSPMAEIVSWGIAGVDPTEMGIGPVPASRLALSRAGLSLDDIDLVEVNEAFGAQYLSVVKELGLDLEKTNVNGGAVALGHPVGASGARLLITLAYELKERGLKHGLATLCIGGGQGIAMVIKNSKI